MGEIAYSVESVSMHIIHGFFSLSLEWEVSRSEALSYLKNLFVLAFWQKKSIRAVMKIYLSPHIMTIYSSYSVSNNNLRMP